MEHIAIYIAHPERLNRDTLYELRMIVGKFPYFDAARLLMLRNLYLLHDMEFGKELRKAALYLKDRRVLLELMSNYGRQDIPQDAYENESVDRTMSLIDAFLNTLPQDKFSLEAEGAAAVDYVTSYLSGGADAQQDVPKLRGQELIDDFLAGENEKITLQLRPENYSSESSAPQADEDVPENSFFTETLANIYIKQKKYDKAIEIIRRLCLEYPNKNRYFADQIRFLEKIVKFQKVNN